MNVQRRINMRYISFLIIIAAIAICGSDFIYENSFKSDLSRVNGNQSNLKHIAASLTGKIETENFIFHFKPGDEKRIEIERMEAFHKWAVKYLSITPPKKIDYYMFPTMEEMNKAFGVRFGGMASPPEFALVTAFPWHNHECFHLYTSLIGTPPRIFGEGMVIAHEFDPHNNVWISQWNRLKPYPKPHIEIVRKLKSEGKLYSLDSIIESGDFNMKVSQEKEKIAYEQAGAWITFLKEKFGLEKLKKIIALIPYSADRTEIKVLFRQTLGISLEDSEKEFLSWLDK